MHSLNYNKTFFLQSYSKITDIKIQNGIEIAFVGYSNSGKSSAINTLTNQKKLSRFSKTPGRTQLINFFQVTSEFRIVDLPGYGYAQAPLLLKKKWQKMLYHYLEERSLLKGIVLLMDIRRPLKILDRKIINISINYNIPILILLTKCDKIAYNKQNLQLKITYKKLESLSNLLKIECFSSFKKIGVKQLKYILDKLYKDNVNNKN